MATVSFPNGPKLVIALAALVAAGFLFLLWRAIGMETVSNFSECERYPGSVITQTDPASCYLPNGKSFPER